MDYVKYDFELGGSFNNFFLKNIVYKFNCKSL